MRPLGRRAWTRSAVRSWRTSWQKTFCSRTRRAISWPYWAPKSKTRIRSLSGRVVILVHRLFLIRELGKQFIERRFVVDVAIAAETLNFNLNFIIVIDEFDFPALAGN